MMFSAAIVANCHRPLLAANSTTLSVAMVPDVTITGDPGDYTLQYASLLGGGASNWVTLTTNITLTGAMTNWLDYSGVGQAPRFYRTVAATNGVAPPANTSWVYHNGVFDWPGDWSFAGTPNYHDTAGLPLTGAADIAFTLTGQWGGWLPYAPNQSFSLAPYNYLTIAIKTTVATQPIHIFFVAAGDTPVGTSVDPTAGGYGPPAVVGQWCISQIPLSAFNAPNSPVAGTTILKFGVQDDSGGVNTFYIDEVGFMP